MPPRVDVAALLVLTLDDVVALVLLEPLGDVPFVLAEDEELPDDDCAEDDEDEVDALSLLLEPLPTSVTLQLPLTVELVKLSWSSLATLVAVDADSVDALDD